MLFIIAQIIGFAGMFFNIFSFQCKSQKKLISLQLIGAFTFTIHFLLLCIHEGMFLMGLALNVLGIVRAYVYSHKEQCHADHPAWLYGLCVTYIISYILTFTVFGTPATTANFIIEALPIIAMIANTIGFSMKEARHVRLLGLINSPAWMAYNAIRASIPGVIGEIFGLSSVIVGIIRLDLKREKKQA